MSDLDVIVVDILTRDAGHAAEAARSLAMFHGNISAHIDCSTIAIAGARDETVAQHYWRVALLNERLLAEATAERNATLALLVA